MEDEGKLKGGKSRIEGKLKEKIKWKRKESGKEGKVGLKNK